MITKITEREENRKYFVCALLVFPKPRTIIYQREVIKENQKIFEKTLIKELPKFLLLTNLAKLAGKPLCLK